MKQAHFKIILEEMLKTTPEGFEESTIQRICLQVISKALEGDLKSINFIRDTIGQQPFKEMLINEFMLNSEIEKTNQFLMQVKEDTSEATTTAQAIANALIGKHEENNIQEALYKKCLSVYGIEVIKEFIAGTRSGLSKLDELSELLFGEDQ